jgi:hypothetical protein
MPLTILIVEKNGNIKEQKVNNINENELYKKVGLKSSNGFTLQTQWNINKLKGKTYNIHLYGKTEGRANYENKYEFPPPVDEKLFFGNCILINKNTDDEYTNLTKADWNIVYDHLYGGFDDLDDEEDSEDDVDDDVPRTKSGYVKDGFIVDDEDEDEDYDGDADYDDKKYNKKTRPVRKSTRNKKNENTIFNTFISNNENSNYLECTGELSEEEYL